MTLEIFLLFIGLRGDVGLLRPIFEPIEEFDYGREKGGYSVSKKDDVSAHCNVTIRCLSPSFTLKLLSHAGVALLFTLDI